MLRTRVGYCGGKTEHPTYRSIGDHTEAIAIDYDPSLLSYRDLIRRFWDNHYCASNVGGSQYKKAVFWKDNPQRSVAEETRAEAAAKAGLGVESVRTEIVPASEFTYAEEYHQKYALTPHRELRSFLSEAYPSTKAFADSTVATRLNAWLGSGFNRNKDTLAREIDRYGLPEKWTRYVLAKVGVEDRV